MRNNKEPSSVFSDLTAAATDDDSGTDQYELTIGSAEKVDDQSVEFDITWLEQFPGPPPKVRVDGIAHTGLSAGAPKRLTVRRSRHRRTGNSVPDSPTTHR